MVLMDYLGSHGVFLAFIVGILVTKINIYIVDKKITVKMPEGVPENVTQSFIALVPGAVVAIVCGILRGLFLLTPWGNILDAVYAVLQTPLANVTGSLPGFLILILLAQVLWFFGVHGSYTVLAILYPIWFTYLGDNMAAAAAGEVIPHMWNVSMYDFATLGGCGCTLGLVIVMFFCAKSERYKAFSKIVLPCGLFNINEPMVYGMPLMMNFTFLIPFIVTPLLSLLMLFNAVRDLPIHVFAALGAIDPNSLTNVPDNVELGQMVPQLDILSQADVFITHAGMGGTGESIYYGVPMIAIPQMDEQAITARQIEKLGLGYAFCDKNAITSEKLRAAILSCLGNPAYKLKVQEFSEDMKFLGGAKASADALIKFILKTSA